MVERAPTKKELAEHQQQLPWSWYPKVEIKKFYDHPSNGRLTITIGSRLVRDSKTKTAEEALLGVYSAESLERIWTELPR